MNCNCTPETGLCPYLFDSAGSLLSKYCWTMFMERKQRATERTRRRERRRNRFIDTWNNVEVFGHWLRRSWENNDDKETELTSADEKLPAASSHVGYTLFVAL